MHTDVNNITHSSAVYKDRRFLHLGQKLLVDEVDCALILHTEHNHDIRLCRNLILLLPLDRHTKFFAKFGINLLLVRSNARREVCDCRRLFLVGECQQTSEGFLRNTAESEETDGEVRMTDRWTGHDEWSPWQGRPLIVSSIGEVRQNTYLVGFNELDAFLDTTHCHQHEHDRDIRNGIVEHPRRVSDLDTFCIASFDVDMVWQSARILDIGNGREREWCLP